VPLATLSGGHLVGYGLLDRLRGLLHSCPSAHPRLTDPEAPPRVLHEISNEKLNRRIEVSATITEGIADALENAKDLPEEVSNVGLRDIEVFTFGRLRAVWGRVDGLPTG
jgi:hypothetical protein